MQAKEPRSANFSEAQAQERRKKLRRHAEGGVCLSIRDSDSPEIRGLLVDVSASGFRAAHSFKQLCPGQEVAFRHEAGGGVARVVWTRILGQTVESGFFILESITH